MRACTGCGKCCQEEVCVIGMMTMNLPNDTGPCPALEWNGARYLCGIVTNPAKHMDWIADKPKEMIEWWQGYVKGIFCFGIGCDSDIDDISVQPPPYLNHTAASTGRGGIMSTSARPTRKSMAARYRSIKSCRRHHQRGRYVHTA